jgi:Tfp pilus assembly protein PilF
VLAIEDFTTAVGLNPNATEPYMARGLSYLALRDWGAAIEDFDAVLGRDSRNLDAWINRGIAYEASGDNQNALVSYQRALTINENSTVARQGLGRVN